MATESFGRLILPQSEKSVGLKGLKTSNWKHTYHMTQ